MSAGSINPVELSSRGWFAKAFAGLLLGFTLAIALSCSFEAVFSDGDAFFSAQGQVAMWLVAPIWCGVLSFCFLFRSPTRAWLGLSAANLVGWGFYAVVRLLTS